MKLLTQRVEKLVVLTSPRNSTSKSALWLNSGYVSNKSIVGPFSGSRGESGWESHRHNRWIIINASLSSVQHFNAVNRSSWVKHQHKRRKKQQNVFHRWLIKEAREKSLLRWSRNPFERFISWLGAMCGRLLSSTLAYAEKRARLKRSVTQLSWRFDFSHFGCGNDFHSQFRWTNELSDRD